MVPSPSVFAYYLGVILRGLAHFLVVWLISKSELSAGRHVLFVGGSRQGLNSRALAPWMMSDLGILVPMSSALWRIIDDIGFPTIVDTSSFDQVLSYVAGYRRGESTGRSSISETCLCCSTSRLGVSIHRRRRWYPVASMVLGIAYPISSSTPYQLVSAKGHL